MNLDVSVAPELAQLIGPPVAAATAPAAASVAAPAVTPGHQDAPAATIGRLAQELRLITAAPERWWGLVRFDPEHPVRIEIPAGDAGPGGAAAPSCEVWLMITPPSPRAARAAEPAPSADCADGTGGAGAGCRCEVVTVIAGELTEQQTERLTERLAGQVIGAGAPAATPLPPGRIRVHGRGRLHRMTNRSGGYTVSLHARARRPADDGIIR